MADGSISIAVDADAKQAQKELQRVQRSIQTIEDRIQKINTMRSPLAQQAQELAAQLDRAKEALYQMQNASDGSVSSSQIAAQKEMVAALQAEYNRVQSQVESYDRQLKNANYDLDAAKQKAGALTVEMATASGTAERMAKASEKAAKSMNRFGKRLSSVFRSALIFTVISQGLSALRTWLGKTIEKNDEARAAIAKLKGALLTLAQPILQVIIPVFIKLVNIITQVVTAIAKFLAMLSGKSYSAQVSAAKALNEEEKAIEGVGAAAEDAGKSMANFDEINQLTDNSASSAGAGGTSSGTEIAPDFSNLDMAEDKLNDILGVIGAIAAGLLAWKVASLFTDSLSKIGGIALAAAGAFALVYFWLDAWNNGIDLSNFLGMLVGMAAVAGGLALAFGTTAAAVALVAGGLAMLVVGIKDVIENGVTLENTLTIAAGLFAAGLGISLLTGSWIPALIAGVVGMVGVIAANWDEIANILQGTVGVITGIVSAALLALGAILLLTGANIPLGLGLLAVGGVSLAAAIAPNWGFIQEKIKSCWNDIKGFWAKNIAPVFTKEWWSNLAKQAMNGFISVFEGAINLIAEGVNWLIEQLNKIHIDIPDWVPIIGGKSFGINIPLVGKVELPRLASGAVIPPNREFLAVLGDQKSGTNIETPLSTMVQAFKQALGESGGGRNITIVLEMDRREFARAVYKANNDESQRVGVRLAGVRG